ncbi:hypothetical protein [Iningainema tapete]|uniref:Uncharacterized protein n=1 Tax=Iningainema tapete BLCC-T55 TaxID=2748662 RepID=A0A8J6XLF1_9CYAN|nr:hypothetical protein [Iningainema tapete]MBD2772597.1 hypothetical protein [Iningainema tapete BLCC-T55]
MHPNFILEGFWDGLSVKYIHSGNAIRKALIMYVANTETLEANWLNYIPKNRRSDYLLISLTPSLLKQIFGKEIFVSHYPFFYQIKITNPSILYLAHLLQIEMETPNILGQDFVSAIVTAMITSCELSNLELHKQSPHL